MSVVWDESYLKNVLVRGQVCMTSVHRHMFLISTAFLLQGDGQTNGIRSRAKNENLYMYIYVVNEPPGSKSDSCRYGKHTKELIAVEFNTARRTDLNMGRGGWEQRSSLNHVLLTARSTLGDVH